MKTCAVRFASHSFSVNPLGTRKLLADWNSEKKARENRLIFTGSIIRQHRVPEFFRALESHRGAGEFVKLFLSLGNETDPSCTELVTGLTPPDLAQFAGMLKPGQLLSHLYWSDQAPLFFRAIKPTDKGTKILFDYIEGTKNIDELRPSYRQILDNWGVELPDEEWQPAKEMKAFEVNPQGTRELLKQWQAAKRVGREAAQNFAADEVCGAERVPEFFWSLQARGEAADFARLFLKLSLEEGESTQDDLVMALDPKGLAAFVNLLSLKQLVDYFSFQGDCEVSRLRTSIRERLFEGVRPSARAFKAMEVYLETLSEETRQQKSFYLDEWRLKIPN